ncbi:MAG: 1-acyl-sn-glycerol-3-phosphate acyltransferase [Gammaproteobacteria bacterium]|nr:1-acyl-sn-glycerol-3-phosphate acyltransferase [Gammaproteobacteria bacterium]
MRHLRSLLFYLGMLLATILFVVPSPLFLPFSQATRSRYFSLWAYFVIWWLKVTCNLGVHVEGLENIPAGNALILAKHQSAWETIFLQTLFPPQTWVLKRELLWLPIFGWGLALARPIAIDRAAGKKALRQVITQGIDRLQHGLWVVIFPEGTRTTPGQRQRYAIGGAMLAEKSGYPVVPICHNAGEFWPKQGFAKMAGVITVVIGEPISPAGMRAGEINARVEEWIESTYRRITTLPTQ